MAAAMESPPLPAAVPRPSPSAWIPGGGNIAWALSKPWDPEDPPTCDPAEASMFKVSVTAVKSSVSADNLSNASNHLTARPMPQADFYGLTERLSSRRNRRDRIGTDHPGRVLTDTPVAACSGCSLCLCSLDLPGASKLFLLTATWAIKLFLFIVCLSGKRKDLFLYIVFVSVLKLYRQ